jgi:hypothetical protein
MSIRIARCACSQLRITCEGEPERVSICACTACQRRTGSVYGVGAYFDQRAIKLMEGESKVFNRTSDAGRWLRMHFCPSCGTTVYWEAEFMPGKMGVAVGAFVDASLQPRVAVWAQHKSEWVPLPEGIPTHDQAVPSR